MTDVVRLTVDLDDKVLATTTIQRLNKEIIQERTYNGKDYQLRRDINAAIKALELLLKDWWGPIHSNRTGAPIQAFSNVDGILPVKLTRQMLRKRIIEEQCNTDTIYRDDLTKAWHCLNKVIIDIWGEPSTHESAITLICTI